MSIWLKIALTSGLVKPPMLFKENVKSTNVNYRKGKLLEYKTLVTIISAINR